MTGWLLAASVLFELQRTNVAPNVAAWSDAQPHSLAVCARNVRAYLDVGVSAFSPWERVTDPR